MRYGYFDEANREYCIDRVDVPVSWTNYIGVEDMCAVVNHTAGGYMFYKSPQYHRITRFRPNGVPMDRPGHYVYLRDDADGDYWSISWQPVGKSLQEASYRCRHGLSYSVYECDYRDIQASQTLLIPLGDDVELWDVKIKNTGSGARTLSVYSYCEFSFHHIDMDNQNFQMSLYAAGSSYAEGIIEYDLFYEEFGYHYFTANFTPDGFDCMRDKFIGPYRTESNPQAVETGVCGGTFDFGVPIERISRMDGCKIYFENGGWIIARFSGMEPLLRVFCEMETKEEAKRCCKVLKDMLSEYLLR